jgi:hypothetical protein
MSRIDGITASTNGDPSGRGLEVVPRGVMVDQVFDERLRAPDGRLPRLRVVADDLVRILAVGQTRDAHVLELDARVVPLELGDEPGSAVTPTVPAFSPAGSTS